MDHDSTITTTGRIMSSGSRLLAFFRRDISTQDSQHRNQPCIRDHHPTIHKLYGGTHCGNILSMESTKRWAMVGTATNKFRRTDMVVMETSSIEIGFRPMALE